MTKKSPRRFVVLLYPPKGRPRVVEIPILNGFTMATFKTAEKAEVALEKSVRGLLYPTASKLGIERDAFRAALKTVVNQRVEPFPCGGKDWKFKDCDLVVDVIVRYVASKTKAKGTKS